VCARGTAAGGAPRALLKCCCFSLYVLRWLCGWSTQRQQQMEKKAIVLVMHAAMDIFTLANERHGCRQLRMDACSNRGQQVHLVVVLRWKVIQKSTVLLFRKERN